MTNGMIFNRLKKKKKNGMSFNRLKRGLDMPEYKIWIGLQKLRRTGRIRCEKDITDFKKDGDSHIILMIDGNKFNIGCTSYGE